MITWMQKHKKYLIITIWISAISFIAAGMVGWGTYNFSSSSSLAKVGRISIGIDDFNREYQAIYSQYNEQYTQLMGKALDNEQAKLLNLDSIAMQRLIDKALLENFALDSGIRISDEEVLREIQKNQSFKKENGDSANFDAETYKEVLRLNHIKPATFEENIRKDLLIQKILAIFPSIVTPLENEVLSMPENLQDRLSIEIIADKQIPIKIEEKALREFYEKNKESYKTNKSFEIEVIATPLSEITPTEDELKAYYEMNKANYLKSNEDSNKIADFGDIKDNIKADFQKKEAQKNALKTYNDFINGKTQGKKQTITQSQHNESLIKTLDTLKNGEIIKPIFYDNQFLTIKMVNKIPQNIKTFEEAKNDVYQAYYPIAKKEAIEKYAQARINIFQGKDLGFFSLNDIKSINGLADFEKQQLLLAIFTSDKRNGYVLLGDKVVLYRVLEQKILKNDKKDYRNIKSQFLEQTLIDFLSKQYKIINNFKKDS